MPNIPPHIKRIATLPYDLSVTNSQYLFQVIAITLLFHKAVALSHLRCGGMCRSNYDFLTFKFTIESVDEVILKIGLHSVKLWSRL